MELKELIAVRPAKKVYKDGDLAIKVFEEGFSKADILNEALNHARVEETGLPIPRIHEVTKIGNQWAIVMDFIKGKTLTQLMKENPEKFEEYMNRFVDIQLLIHSKKAPLLNKHRDKMHRKISESGLDATTRYELHTRLESMPKHTKICHGDFHPSNIICGEDGVDYIIDWSHATQGNASADTARTYLLFCLEGDMRKADYYMNLFCKKSDTAKQYVQKWLPIVAASQLVKGKPEEREFLIRWTNVVDFE